MIFLTHTSMSILGMISEIFNYCLQAVWHWGIKRFLVFLSDTLQYLFANFLKKWIIHVFLCNFLIDNDRSLRNVASKSKFQEHPKPLIFFEIGLSFAWDMSKDLKAWKNWWHLLIIFKKWIIHVFSCNFLLNKDRSLGNVASKKGFQELSKPLIYFENQLNSDWDISLSRWFHTFGQGRNNDDDDDHKDDDEDDGGHDLL